MKILKSKWISFQTTEARRSGTVPLSNGKSIPIFLAYRCLYCGEYYNQTQAEEHFGQTRAQWRKEVGPPGHFIEVSEKWKNRIK